MSKQEKITTEQDPQQDGVPQDQQVGEDSAQKKPGVSDTGVLSPEERWTAYLQQQSSALSDKLSGLDDAA